MAEGDELDRAIEDLAAALEELRDELAAERRPSRTRNLARFTEQYAIPTVIAVLETNVRLLEALRGAVRPADERLDAERDRRVGRTLDALDDALGELEAALAGSPEPSEARRLLAEARDLRAEAERRVTETRRGDRPESARRRDDRPADERSGTERGAPDGTRRSGAGPHEVPVDVEAELETIKAEIDGSDDETDE